MINNKFNIKKMGTTRYRYTSKEVNKLNERLVIDLEYINCKNEQLPKLWKKHGYTDKLYTNYIHIDSYIIEPDGTEKVKYNPTIKLSDDKKRYVINFDWMLEISKENKEKLINKIYNDFIQD